MSKGQMKIWREISRKLDQLIILSKLSNRKLIEEYRRMVRRDKVSAKILSYSDGSLSYSRLAKEISKELGVAEITVKRKVSDLKDKGFLVAERRGREVYYTTSGLFD